MGTLILVIAVAATAFHVVRAEADSAMSLRPQSVECIGTFCHTGVVTMADKTFNFALKSKTEVTIIISPRRSSTSAAET